MPDSKFKDVITFRILISLYAIQIIFWVGTAIIVLASLYLIGELNQGGRGLILLIVGPIIWRLYCEIFIVIFRINDSLLSIKSSLGPSQPGSFSPAASPLTPVGASSAASGGTFQFNQGTTVAAPQPADQNSCAVCGTENEAGSKFCTGCGRALA